MIKHMAAQTACERLRLSDFGGSVSLGGPLQLSALVCRWLRWGLLNEIPFSPPVCLLSALLLRSMALSAGFHLPATSLAASFSFITASAEGHLGQGRLLLFHHSFSARSPFPFFMRLSGLCAAVRRSGFGMKCLLTEPCAPELR